MLLGGVVYQDVELAELLHRLSDRLAAEILVAYVARDQVTPAALLFHQTLGLFRVFMLIQVHDADVGALFCERNCDRSSDAAVASRDHGDFVREFAAAPMRVLLLFRLIGHFGFNAGTTG